MSHRGIFLLQLRLKFITTVWLPKIVLQLISLLLNCHPTVIMSQEVGEVPARREGEEEVEEIATVAASTNTAVSCSPGSARFRFAAGKDLALLLREVHVVNPCQF